MPRTVSARVAPARPWGGPRGRPAKLALGALAAALLLVLALRMPVAHLSVLIAVAVIAPNEILNRFAAGGGLGSAGLSAVDLLVLTGLARVALELADQRLESRQLWAGSGIAVFLCLALVQLPHGVGAGYPAADAVAEFRVLLGLAAIFLALPLVAERDRFLRLCKGLIVVGIAVGLWGILQWVLHLRFEGAGGGVVEGGRFPTGGRVAGLYAFPVCVVLGACALTSGCVDRRTVRVALAVLVILNLAALALTFERSFWIAIVVGLLFVMLRVGWRQRVRLTLGVPLLALGLAGCMSVVAPAELNATFARVGTLSGYRTDPSVT